MSGFKDSQAGERVQDLNLQNHCMVKHRNTASHLLSTFPKFTIRSLDLVKCFCMQDEDASSFRELFFLKVNSKLATF